MAEGVAPLIWGIGVAVFSYLLVPAMLPLYHHHRVKNYRGELVPAGLGYAFILPAVFVSVLRWPLDAKSLTGAVLLLVFAALGSVDDACGSQKEKGWRGHLLSVRFSTGILKAVGGGAAALIAAAPVSIGWLDLIIDAGLVALSANFLNLLDLRPGRAAKAFLLLGLPLNLTGADSGSLKMLSWAVAGYLPWDLRRKAMMGDTGSNTLGAALGWQAARGLPLIPKAVLTALLIGLNLLSEKVSFSTLIERSRFLHFLDQLGR